MVEKKRQLSSRTSTEVHFYDPIPQLKQATFDSMSLSSLKISGKEVMLKADRDIFTHLLVVARTRDMDSQDSSSISWALFMGLWLQQIDSPARLSCQSYLSHWLKQSEPAEDVPPTAALIVDGMAVLQAVKEIPAIFKKLSAAVFDSVVPKTTLPRRVDFVTETGIQMFLSRIQREQRVQV